MPEEKALIGGKAIADYYGWSLAKLRKETKRMKQSGAVKTVPIGRPPNRRIMLVALPSLLQRHWVMNVKNY